MPTRVRSYSKINLGLAIGAPRPDGFHSLLTLYQTLELHDVVTVSARRARTTVLRLESTDPRVPTDARNTAWKMVEKTLQRLSLSAEVVVHIQKNLPIQGGMGAGSANAAAALLGLERELGLQIPDETRLEIAAHVGSDVPLFLVGGAVLGTDRGQVVEPVADIALAGNAAIWCVVALPKIGVSTPAAFQEWDKRFAADPDLHNLPVRDTIEELSRTYASVLRASVFRRSNLRKPNGLIEQSGNVGASGIFPDPSPLKDTPEKQQGLSREQRHMSSAAFTVQDESGIEDDLAENSLLALVRTGIENDFETVVFPQYPLLREIKRQLMGPPASATAAEYAALSGSGSALFGLYRSQANALAAQQRLQQHGTRAIVTKTISRNEYWSNMFAE